MAMELQHSKSADMSAFVSNFYSGDEQVRFVRYYAVAQVVVSYFLEKKGEMTNQNQLKLDLSKVINHVCEITVVDRLVFTTAVDKMLLFYTNRIGLGSISTNLLSANSFIDILGLCNYFSTDDIFTINKNFFEYKNTLIMSMKVIKELVPDVLL